MPRTHVGTHPTWYHKHIHTHTHRQSPSQSKVYINIRWRTLKIIVVKAKNEPTHFRRSFMPKNMQDEKHHTHVWWFDVRIFDHIYSENIQISEQGFCLSWMYVCRCIWYYVMQRAAEGTARAKLMMLVPPSHRTHTTRNRGEDGGRLEEYTHTHTHTHTLTQYQ